MKPDDDTKPVAYDTEGRPLYLHPDASPTASAQDKHQELEVVQVTRSTDPVAVKVSSQMEAKHQASKQKYPQLNLSAGEFVILDIRRHPIGLLTIWVTGALLILLIVAAWLFALSQTGLDRSSTISLFALGLSGLVALFTYIATVVYRKNRLILTSESIIQHVQTSLFSAEEKTINLENVKDARFVQAGIAQSMVGYGSICMTTEGDQQNYSFTYVARPKNQIAIINNVIEAVKYGRPIDEAIHSAAA